MVTTTDRIEVDRLLVEWWTDVLAQESLGDQWETAQVENLRTKCSSLPAGSYKVGLTAPDTLARDATDEERGIGALLLGESAAAVVRNGSSAVALDRAVKFLSECWEAVEVLVERLSQAPAWPGTLETLAPATAELAGLLGRHFERRPGNDVLLDEERKVRERGLLTYFWGRQIDAVCLNHSTLVRLTLLAARDWQSLARQAEALPLRELREDLWRHLHLHEDRDAILSLLRAAPPVFSASKWTGSTSALTGLVAAIAHGDQLHAQLTRTYPPTPDVEAKLKGLVEQEIPEWLKQVVEAAIARPDGRLLLLLFGASLVREALRPPSNGQRPWSSARHALCAIHGVLTPKPSVAELQQVASAGGAPSNRADIDHATYLVTSAAFDACANDVLAWYRDLLLQSVDDLCWQAKNWRRSLCYETLAERLGQLTDPFEEWMAVWKTLFVTDREHARFATLDQNALYPSRHLLRVGTELLRQAPSRSGSRKFFEELLAHTHRLLTNDARLISPLSPELAVDGIDVAPRVLGSDWPQSLEAHRLLLSNAKSRLYVATLLLEGGAPFGDVEAAVEAPGHRLVDSVAEMKQSNRMDLNDHRLCEIITAAAREHARTRTEEEP
ncbi:hypothetical protein WMF28_38040 [Sorangium sp. So ce590]|uniref:hypothetical protein n=1 Tax=Sorangium sp. So ce590 TaxID=3133317 RepID=UPI003F6365D6